MRTYFVVAAHRDRAAAEGDFHRLEALRDDPAFGALDAVVLVRTGTEEFRFTIAADGDPREGVACGLARGLALAVSPGLASRWEAGGDAARVGVGVVVDRVAAAVGRGGYGATVC